MRTITLNMNIQIKDSRKLSDLQRDFQEMFPYLKLEFYARPHVVREQQKTLNPNLTIGECRKSIKEGVISIEPSNTVRQVEKAFTEEFGLYPQVFRKSGNLWIETTLTDHWTLFQQNMEGGEMSRPNTTEENIDFSDRDQWE
ncbi:MAG: hypothetical protein SFW35_07895 [Chitinophagales bacterium]|nr:hypothetical protein [Chitinophagales bacterium]